MVGCAIACFENFKQWLHYAHRGSPHTRTQDKQEAGASHGARAAEGQWAVHKRAKAKVEATVAVNVKVKVAGDVNKQEQRGRGRERESESEGKQQRASKSKHKRYSGQASGQKSRPRAAPFALA